MTPHLSLRAERESFSNTVDGVMAVTFQFPSWRFHGHLGWPYRNSLLRRCDKLGGRRCPLLLVTSSAPLKSSRPLALVAGARPTRPRHATGGLSTSGRGSSYDCRRRH